MMIHCYQSENHPSGNGFSGMERSSELELLEERRRKKLKFRQENLRMMKEEQVLRNAKLDVEFKRELRNIKAKQMIDEQERQREIEHLNAVLALKRELGQLPTTTIPPPQYELTAIDTLAEIIRKQKMFRVPTRLDLGYGEHTQVMSISRQLLMEFAQQKSFRPPTNHQIAQILIGFSRLPGRQGGIHVDLRKLVDRICGEEVL